MQFASFDYETMGTQDLFALQPFRALSGNAWPSCIAFTQRSGDGTYHVWSERHPRAVTIRKFLRDCIDQKLTITGWNTPFDVAWLIAQGFEDLVDQLKFVDGMSMLRQLRSCPTFEMTKEHPGYGLKAAVAEFIPEAAGYEEEVTFNPTTPEEWARLEEYNERDTLYTLQLTEMFWARMTPRQKRVCLVESACIPMVAKTLVDGVKGNYDKASVLAEKLSDDAKTAFVKLKLAAPEVTPEILASPHQLAELLNKGWGLPPIRLTEKNNYSTDREALAALALMDPRAALVNEYREAQNNCTKFARGMVNSLDYNGDGCTRPAHRIYGTYTGRMTISGSQGKGVNRVPTGIPLHQWKRDPAFRDLIEVPEGYDLLEFDFAGQEFRWMAVLSNDFTMQKLCLPGEDAHSYMAAKIVGEDYHRFMDELHNGSKERKAQRQLGKVANLSLQYRTSANKLMRVAAIQHNIKLDYNQAQMIWRTYQRTYPGVPAYWKKQKSYISSHTFVENLAGRRVHTLPVHKRNPEHSWSYDSTAVNYPIQSMGAEQKYLALMVLRTMLPRFQARFYFELHDGLFILCPKSNTVRAIPEIKQALSNLPYARAFGFTPPVSFPVDAKWGPSWGRLVEWTE